MTGLDTPRRGVTTALGRWCRDRRVSYEDLADKVGLSRRMVVRYAVGERIPSTTAVLALRRETGLSFEDLILGSYIGREAAASRGTMGPSGERKGQMR